MFVKIEGGGVVGDIYVLVWMFEVKSRMRLLGGKREIVVLRNICVEI